MSGRIHGIPVTLHTKTKTGEDAFGAPIYSTNPVIVDNVLVSPAKSGGEDIIDTQQLEGKRAEYVLAIPKGDAHEWRDSIVEFFGLRWRTFGLPTEGIEENIPLEWNKKVLVERYE